MCTIKAPCHVKDLGTAVRIYYSYPEIGNSEIKELFGRNFPIQRLRDTRA